jgi:hypothetical protein
VKSVKAPDKAELPEEGIKALSSFRKDTRAFQAAGTQTGPKEAPRFETQAEPDTDDEDDGPGL